MPTLVVAAISARALAESAVRDGYAVTALDLFGDADTRAACAHWSALGAPGSLHLDGDRLLSALSEAARHGDVLGWVPGAGFEGRAELLAQGAGVLRLIGNDADTVRRVRDPQAFFGCLDRLGLAHPETRFHPPEAHDAGWLVKDAGGTGGWHIRRWDASRTPPSPTDAHRYYQREAHGTPMSATFIGNGIDACVLGINALTVRRFGTRPHVYCGAVGPLAVPPAVRRQLENTVRALVRALSLRGLGSLDVLVDGDAVSVLELNPRPPASLALYEGCRFRGTARADTSTPTHGLFEAHLRACLRGELPALAETGAPAAVHGVEVVYAQRTVDIDDALSKSLTQWVGVHDVPVSGSRCTVGDPICSVSAAGADPDEVKRLLKDRRKALQYRLEP